MAIPFVALAALACNALLGIDELTPYTDVPGSSSSSSSSSSSGDAMDAGGDSGNPGGDAGSEGDAGVAPCDPNEIPDQEHGLFVRWDAPPNGDGRINAPFTKLADALERAASLGGEANVYVYEGTYNETAPLRAHDLPKVTIDGAWIGALPNWTRNCQHGQRMRTVINAADGHGLSLERIAQPSALRNFSLYTGLQGGDGSRIALRVIDSASVLLYNVALLAEDGASPASPPPRTDSAPPWCNGTCVPPHMIVHGGSGADVFAFTNGVFDTSGYRRGRGVPGGDGTPGSRALGGPGETLACTDSCTTNCAPVISEHTGAPGHCGCGGGGGLGGEGGLGGGASVGILTNSNIRAEYSIIRAKHGGGGAAGGAGAAGGEPTQGDPGPSTTCTPGVGGCCMVVGDDCALSTSPAAHESCRQPPQTIDGGAGGLGGRGGPGGKGGPGSGGPSYAVVTLGQVEVSWTQSQLAHGQGGAGAPPAPGGATGIVHKQIP